jgi:steroid 17alpha-monooxygenase/17alpha-hydroxyprogesterone aldolase/cytochrome P450 family 1 subfamily A polypeptide 1
MECPVVCKLQTGIMCSFITFTVLQNTMVLTGLYSYHNDPDVWGDPHVYRPERFLDENGTQLKKDVSLPFGAG